MNVTTKLVALPSLALVLLLAVLVSACGGGAKSRFPETVVIGQNDFLPQIINSELVVGPNRFALGVLTPQQVPIVDARVHLAFYELNGGAETKVTDMDAVSRVPARDSGLTEQVEHIHTDGTRHIHVNVGEEVGIYTAQVDFPRAGNWGVEISVEADSPKVKKTLPIRFTVLDKGPTPAVGSPAPRSRNLTAADVSDISQIDSSAKPSVDMHTTTIADAIAAGRPTLVLFAVPGYCSSRLCGPELEIMRKLYPSYRDRMEFIHVEFYKDPASPNRQPVDAVGEWNLQSEPWFFLIDSKGMISAKFEGPTSLQELEQAIKTVLAGS